MHMFWLIYSDLSCLIVLVLPSFCFGYYLSDSLVTGIGNEFSPVGCFCLLLILLVLFWCKPSSSMQYILVFSLLYVYASFFLCLFVLVRSRHSSPTVSVYAHRGLSFYRDYSKDYLSFSSDFIERLGVLCLIWAQFCKDLILNCNGTPKMQVSGGKLNTSNLIDYYSPVKSKSFNTNC